MKDCNGGAYGLPLSVLQLQSQPKEVSLDRNEFPFLTNAQVEELNEIGYVEVTDEMIEKMAKLYDAEVVD